MARGFSPPRLARILLLLLLGFFAISLEAAPMGLAADAWPSPDLLFLVVACFSARRPDATPLLAIASLGLVRDLVTDPPAGAGLLTLVLAAEFLKLVGPGLARRSFATEWALVASLLGLTLLAQWLVVLLLLAHPPYLVELMRQWAFSAALYPAVAFALRWLVGITWRRPAAATGKA